MKTAKLLLIMIIPLFSGCAPTFDTYYEPQSEQGTLHHASVTFSNSKNMILFERKGLKVEVMLGAYLEIWVFVPKGKVFLVRNANVLVSENGKDFDKKYPCKFAQWVKRGEKPATKTLIGYGDRKFDLADMMFDSNSQERGTYYMGSVDIMGLPKIITLQTRYELPEKITIRLPVFETQSHEPIKFSDVTFKQKSAFGISPING